MTQSTTADRARRRSSEPSPAALFLRGFLKNPVMVGSVIPSSDRTIRRMLAPVDWSRVKTFVEYGPGVGTFCAPVLERLAPDARMIAIDTNPDFIDYLAGTIRDSRFTPVRGSAADVAEILADHGESGADHVLSGLPFSTLPPGVADRIAAATADVLRPGGSFLVYQFNPKVRELIAPHFAQIEHAIEWWNVPPAQLWWASNAPA